MNKRTSMLAGLAAFSAVIALAPLFAGQEKKDSAAKKPAVEFNFDSRPIDRSSKVRVTSYADTLARITPAVVSIRTEQTVQVIQRNPFRSPLDDLFDLYGMAPPRRRGQPDAAPRTEKRPMGLGSGTIIHADGYILTNRHVISDNEGDPAEEITVELADKRQFKAKVIGSDPKTDIAIIKIEAPKLPVAQVADSGALRVGDIVFAVGNPLGVGMSVSQGIVSALAREVGILRSEQGLESFIQTDASINPGNSGGPLVDADGRVVGVNTAIASPTRASVGIGFAVPSSLALDIITSLVNQGGVARGYFGVETQYVTPGIAERLGLPTPTGAFVTGVEENSAADKAGIRPEDTITQINGESVENPSSLRYLVSKLKPGEKARVEVVRDGKKKTIEITVGSQKAESDSLEALFPGFEFRSLNKELRTQYSISPRIKEGVVITKNGEANPHTLLGRFLRPGTVIVAVNRTGVATPEDLAKAIHKGSENILRIYANGRFHALSVKL
ncbi:MAG: Do family serine endopeptidase [Puniceicoccales bacterium]|nr:Do family serine endopeptidase [Puniceicoccales bacterium]